MERGELRADLDLELAIDGLIGPIVYRVLISGGDPAAVRGLPERVLDQALAGLAPSAGAARRRAADPAGLARASTSRFQIGARALSGR